MKQVVGVQRTKTSEFPVLEKEPRRPGWGWVDGGEEREKFSLTLSFQVR